MSGATRAGCVTSFDSSARRSKLPKLTIERLDLAGKRVFLRADLNAPVAGGRLGDETRLRAVVPTIQLALKAGAAVVLASHLGRPRGHVAPEYSLRPVAERLEAFLGQRVELVPDCVGQEPYARAGALKPGEILLLENLRFRGGEEANDDGFARELAALADCYVNDSVESDRVETARAALEAARRRGVRLVLPLDTVVAERADSSAGRAVGIREIPAEAMGLDIGPRTAESFAVVVRTAKTVVWNGPMGVFERPLFAAGTLAVARAVAEARGFSVVGGGDTIAALATAGVTERIGYVSTAGGAFLEFLEGRRLPGVEALTEAPP